MLLLVLIICSLHDCESLREGYLCHKIIYCWQKDEGTVTHSSTLAWKIPWTGEPGRLQSMGSLRVGYDWATSLSRIREGNGNLLQYSCLENSMDRWAWQATVHGVAKSRIWLSDFTFTFILLAGYKLEWNWVFINDCMLSLQITYTRVLQF